MNTKGRHLFLQFSSSEKLQQFCEFEKDACPYQNGKTCLFFLPFFTLLSHSPPSPPCRLPSLLRYMDGRKLPLMFHFLFS
jgi:hypothetical protein